MSARWRLSVEGLGRIESADAEIRPLTLLIGENNSGKSYFATLLWGLFAEGGSLSSPEGPELAACDAWAKAHLPPGAPKFNRALTEDEGAMFQRLFEAALKAGKDTLLERLFRSKRVGARSVSFRSVAPAAELHWIHGYDPDRGHLLQRMLPRSTDVADVFSLNPESPLTWAVSGLRNGSVLGGAAPNIVDIGRGTDRYHPGDPVFIPASRTGYMHLYREVVRRRFEAGPQLGPSGEGALTMPAFHFLDFVAFGAGNARRDSYEDACALIESALTGRIEVTPGRGVNEVSYAMNGLPERLSMPLSSALVSELAPLLLVLRGAHPLHVLILEEPESHLHPKLQRVVARAIVRLIRAGVVVVVTTHSATFCQQINNFIKLGSMPPELRSRAQASLKYEDADYLLADEVVGHRFDVGDDGKTRVSELQRTESGIVMPPFNRELADLQDEVRFLAELLAEESS
ncbi:AAA family ATPase [Polyangium aurulentum]|uniref:AAA family ATPase n=1 Tax=Polyangium aurulentum TaxID=2567896 RepID=UPI0010AE64DA|nr:AAA family ATPase [Polyangium aurulentum]UQA56477.1 AAA family ATPase [Polyangium aurulentum]